MNITYDYYKIFYYVAKYKSFTQAANILLNNQPNITRSINNLESQLECKLFIRSNRGVKLTPEGEKLYSHVSIALEHLQSAELELAKEKSLKSGIVTISTSETALHSILLPTLNKFHNLYPGVRLRISSHSTPEAMRAVKSASADFAVVTTPTDIVSPLKETFLKDFDELLVGSTQYKFLAEKPQNLADLKHYPLICLGKHTKTYEFFNKFYLKNGLIMNPDIEVAATDQMIPMIINNLGIGFVPDNFVEENIKYKNIVVIPLVEKVPKRSICLVEDKSRPLSIAAKEFKKLLCSVN